MGMQTPAPEQRRTADLHWLAFLLTGRRGLSIDIATEAATSFPAQSPEGGQANPYFSTWMRAWSRRVVISKALAGIQGELAASARRVKLEPDHHAALPGRDWSLDPGTTKADLEKALLAIDVFPRAAVVLSRFEGVAIPDAAVLLDADPGLVGKALAIGSQELTRNLAGMRGWKSAPANPAARCPLEALSSIALALWLLPAAIAAERHTADNPPAMALARYVAGAGEVHPWDPETIEIEASLPKLRKEGRLRAVRRLLPIGKPQYQVLESAGDETVKHRVIAQYLSAEVQASEMPAGAVAITPANYKFRYKGSVQVGDRLSYIFDITPRKKRQGLIKGDLWLDGRTGAAVRESGRLVKSPSIFLKQVDVTREMTTAERTTHLTIATRLVGVAELTVHEHPYESERAAADSLGFDGNHP